MNKKILWLCLCGAVAPAGFGWAEESGSIEAVLDASTEYRMQRILEDFAFMREERWKNPRGIENRELAGRLAEKTAGRVEDERAGKALRPWKEQLVPVATGEVKLFKGISAEDTEQANQ